MSEMINGTATEYTTTAVVQAPQDKYDYAYANGRNKEFYPDPTYNMMQHSKVPKYRSHKSRRYEVVGMILRLVDMAGFELAERIVLRDKVTGEVFK